MDYHNINIQQLDYFMAVARHLNFTDAARSLYISQPTLSKQIALLEKAISAQLFIRNKRFVALTTAGTLLYEKLGGIIDQLDAILEQTHSISSGFKSSLYIGCLEGVDTGEFLINATRLFQEKYPDVQISFETNSFSKLRNKMINNELDLSLTLSFEVMGINELEFREIWETSSSILLSDKHPFANKTDLQLKDLKNQPFIMISREETPNGFDEIVSICKKNGFTPNIVKYVQNIESLILCVESGLGVALIDTNLRLHSGNRLIKYPIQDDFISVGIVWRKDTKNPAVKLFADMLL